MKLEGQAEIKGDKIHLSIPLWPLVLLLLSGAVVVGSVVGATEGLKGAVLELKGAINTLTIKIDSLDDRVDRLEAADEAERRLGVPR